jgi:predicted SAM-dependent methyltransferase
MGSDDHKVLYTYQTLGALFASCGFTVNLIEYFDEQGQFHFRDWHPREGMIHRSSRYDERNRDGELHYTSLILDAKKV